MPRRRNDARLADLVEAATRVFIAQGYRRTQIADVAEELGVAKGTIYLYVESKEALFDLALRQSAASAPLPPPPRLPVPTPKPGAAVRFVRERIARDPLVRELSALAGRPAKSDARSELRHVLGRVYDVLAANRTGIKLVDRCAADHPKLADVWFQDARVGLLRVLGRYLAARTRARRLRGFGAPDVTARIVLETLVFWAVHRHWDPSPQTFPEPVVRETVIAFLTAALAGVDDAR